MAPQRATGDIKVDGFGVTIDGDTRRLDFPHAGIDALRGEAGSVEYRAREVVFEALRASLTRMQWSTDAASAGDFVVKDKQGRFERHPRASSCRTGCGWRARPAPASS